jgi:pilus assembly protein FimV
MALSLGRIAIQSALGEPLRAEIDIPDINAEEAASLKAAVAAPEVFVASGLEYSPVLSELQTSLQRRADGRAFIRISSERAVNEPFLDMILEASWSSGRIVRDYTLLLDPPSQRQTPTAPTLAQTAPVSTPAKVTAASDSEAAKAAPAGKAAPAQVATAVKPAAKGESVESARQVTVKDGDTAGKIAAKVKAAGVSLDQMLVALLRSNPETFINDNINRIRLGAVMNVPSTEQALSVAPAEATQIVVAQSKDFNEFRKNLATNAPVAAVAAADRKVSGTVEAKVVEKKPGPSAPDVLKLSKGSISAKASEEKIAKERAEKDAANRAAELAKNIKDLKGLGVAGTAKAAVTAASAPKAATPAVAAAIAPPALPAAPASTPQSAAVSPAASAPAKAPVTPMAMPVQAEAPGILDQLLEDPMVPLAAGGLIALIGGYAAYKVRKRKKDPAQVDSSFLESRLQPDSFFNSNGYQKVDTDNGAPAGNSSMVYSASQLDAADDVDPVAEADVYLAYGRDLQAEEILKEALRTSPGRVAIHTKLLEIFAKRRDLKGFETAAAQAFKLTGASSPEWARICELGLGIDPENPLYKPGGAPSKTPASAPSEVENSAFGSTIPQSSHGNLDDGGSGVDLDLDLDFSLDEEPGSGMAEITATRPEESTVKMDADDSARVPISLDFDISGPADLTESSGRSAALPEISLPSNSIDFTTQERSSGTDFPNTSLASSIANDEKAADGAGTGMMDFDMESLSLDLSPPTEQPVETLDSVSDHPLETKLALAEEFVSIGDEDGARALIEEVVAEATGDVRAKAQRALAALS